MKAINCTVNFKFLVDNEEKNTLILEGSSRSSKTYSIVQYLIIHKLLQHNDYIVRCWRYNSVTHNDTTIQDFKDVMQAIGDYKGIEDYFSVAGKWNSQDKIYTFKNNSKMAFSGLIDEQKIQGKKQNISWFNEAMEAPQNAYRQVMMRTTDKAILDFNPSFNHHWIFSSLFTQIHDADTDVAYKHSTYKDNPFLSDAQIEEIESYDPSKPINVENGTADQWFWDVYGLGKRGLIKGAIFDLWGIHDGQFPDRFLCQRWGYGLDFGFSLDPTALIECALFQDTLYLREVIYETDLLITRNMTRSEADSIESRMIDRGIDKDAKIYADCASPSAIADLRASGYNVTPCTKGPDSIMQGINLLKRRKILIDYKSVNLQREFEHYRWKEISNDTYSHKPVDDFNHGIDAVRYWAQAELQKAQIETMAAHRGKKKINVKSRIRDRRWT